MEARQFDGGAWQFWIEVRAELTRYVARAVQRVPCMSPALGLGGSAAGLNLASGASIRAALGRDSDLHDEVLFDVYRAVALAEARRRFPNEAEERRRWVWIVAGRIARRIARKRVREMGASFDAPGNVDVSLQSTVSPESLVSIWRAQEAVEACLQALPSEERELLGAANDGGALLEFAASRGLPQGTVRSRLSRLRAKLRTCLSEHLELEVSVRGQRAA
jgi:DNA-directed RNA polymerase specialized sigma24 family protein